MHPILNVAVEAAHSAANIMRRQIQHVDAIPFERKARHDYVTEVDKACEEEIVRYIKRYYPDHSFLGEEGGLQGEGDTVWVIDPLDGTSNYMHGIPHFAISIAQQVNGRTEHAVVYDPMRDEIFTASRGSGAFMNQKRLRVSSRSSLESAILATAFPFRQRDQLQAYARVFQAILSKIEDFRRAGTASLDLAWVAAGRLDGFFELGLKPWDVAAGAMIVREAGGVVMDWDGKDSFEESGSILAAPYKLMTPMRQIVARNWKP
ncbi:MAG: inositol monophosphatase family protein [Xanthomonadales bacterium]|jgi:myo-inositol-1(or 4)-monophosphatase|nr:inositol monophosphatase family protein [Xanthomonadales bacterium]